MSKYHKVQYLSQESWLLFVCQSITHAFSEQFLCILSLCLILLFCFLSWFFVNIFQVHISNTRFPLLGSFGLMSGILNHKRRIHEVRSCHFYSLSHQKYIGQPKVNVQKIKVYFFTFWSTLSIAMFENARH